MGVLARRGVSTGVPSASSSTTGGRAVVIPGRTDARSSHARRSTVIPAVFPPRGASASSVALAVEGLGRKRLEIEALEAAQVHHHLLLTVVGEAAVRVDATRRTEEVMHR